MKKIFCFWLFFLLHIMVFGQGNVVSVTVDRQSILIGEPFKLTLKATLPPSARGGWATIDSMPHFEVLDRSAIDTNAAIAGLTLQQTITLTSWDSGRWMIPSILVAGFRTPPIPVAVGHATMDYNQPYHDIKNILAVQKQRSSNWYWYLVGIAVLIALFMLFFPPQKKETKKGPLHDPDVYRNSIKRLDQLDPDQDPKVFYTELINVLRNYLYGKKGIQSFSKTTDDLSVQMKQQLQLPQEHYTQLVQTLRLGDGVKFARFIPTIEENRQSLEVVRKSIVMIEGGKA